MALCAHYSLCLGLTRRIYSHLFWASKDLPSFVWIDIRWSVPFRPWFHRSQICPGKFRLWDPCNCPARVPKLHQLFSHCWSWPSKNIVVFERLSLYAFFLWARLLYKASIGPVKLCLNTFLGHQSIHSGWCSGRQERAPRLQQLRHQLLDRGQQLECSRQQRHPARYLSQASHCFPLQDLYLRIELRLSQHYIPLRGLRNIHFNPAFWDTSTRQHTQWQKQEQRQMPSGRFKSLRTSTGEHKQSGHWRTSGSTSLKTACHLQLSKHLAS